MRKIILSMLVLAGATTYAQVGINEETPKATLDIKAKNLKADSLEGLLIPRVSKNKAFKMTEFTDATDPTKVLTESTMIYVNDLTDYTTSPADAKVADITENGFYFWNGTKWVRSSGANGEEWVYDPTTKQINLKRSGQDTGFTNKVFYDTPTGGFYNYEDESLDDLQDDGTNLPINFAKEGLKNYFQSNSKSIEPYNYVGGGGNTYSSKRLIRNIIYLDETEVSPYPLLVRSIGSGVETSINNVTPTRNLGGTTSYVRKQDSQETKYIVGGGSSVAIKNGSTTGYAYGSYNTVSVASSAEQKSITGSRHQVNVGSDAHVKGMSATVGTLNLTEGSTATIDKAYGAYYAMAIAPKATPTVENIYGLYYNSSSDTNGFKSATVNNSYGLYIEDVKGATADNYAVYTKAGNIRFGDLADSSISEDRLVVANTYGVLSTSKADDFVSLWKKETTNNSIILKVNSAGADRISTAGTTRNDVAITDEGKILAKAFIGYHGAEIFPDYVFEKYYKGYSDIKADYDFHNLASVESFIKKNGHLPGYKSAKEIAKEGLIDISATQLTNVEKIEELYLHLIEKDKEVQSLKEEVKELKALVNQLINK